MSNNNKKKVRCVCGCNDISITPFVEDEMMPPEVEPYPYDYE
jgi:hypothetical protein